MAELNQRSYTIKNNDTPLKIVSHDKKRNYNGIKDVQTENVYDNTAFVSDDNILPTTNNNPADTESLTDDEEEDNSDGCSRAIGKIQATLAAFVQKHKNILWAMFYILLTVAYFVYFSYAMYYRFGDEGSWRLLIVTILCTLALVVKLIFMYRRRHARGEDETDEQMFRRCFKSVEKYFTLIRLGILLPVLLALGITAYVISDVAIDRPRNLISLGGLAVFTLFLFIFSFNPSRVKWRPVFWGMALQLIFAILILRTSWGRDAFQWLSDRITEFLAYTDAGSKFVFGELYENHYFAFKVLPVVVFFSTFVSVLYYLGVMQAVIMQLGRFLAFSMGTSPTESVNAAGNIFIGQTEAPLMIRPFLNDMTNSEIHAVMTGGFATIAGGVMAAYILYNVPANHLLSASVMSAPAALAVSKLFYPETRKTKHHSKDVYNLPKGEERNLIEAASNGASMSIKLVANIAVNLIAFVALLEFVNATLVWIGDRAGYSGLTFQLICSYVFWPIAFLMGVDGDDCRTVAELIGTKTFLNEFVAYIDLSKYINNDIALKEYLANATANVTGNLTGNWMFIGDNIYLNDTGAVLERGLISNRSIVIATYALCGFSNLSSMGIQLGALGAMAPSRKGDLSKIVFRAMIAGNVACFFTACIAGLFYEGD